MQVIFMRGRLGMIQIKQQPNWQDMSQAKLKYFRLKLAQS